MAGEWMQQYESLFSDPEKAQRGWAEDTRIGPGGTTGDLYWRVGQTVTNPYIPEWAQQESQRVLGYQPGEEFRGKSESMMDYLRAVAEGRKSYATEASEAATRRAEAEATGRLKAGPWTTAGQRAAGYAAGEAGMEIGAEGAVAAQKEKLAAQQAYMQAQSIQRQQDVQAELQMEELARRYREAGYTDEQARAEALRQYAKDELTRYALTQKAQAMRESAEQRQLGAFAGAGASLFASLAGGMFKSDIRLKEKIEPADKEVLEFLNALNAKKWDWKEDKSSGLGIIAQDLEKSKIGKELIQEDSKGVKGYSAAHPIVLASLAQINKRLNDLEKK